MSCRTLFLLVAVVAASSLLAVAGDLKPCACDPADAWRSRSYAYGGQFITPPKGAGTVHPDAVMATLVPLNTVKVAVDSAKADAKAPDTVRFDFTGEGKFTGAPSTPLKVLRQPDAPNADFQSAFGPATFDVKRGGQTMKVTVVGTYTKTGNSVRYLSVLMACAAEGSSDFGGKSCKVRLIDGNGNFRLGDVSKVEDPMYGAISGDVLLVDPGDGTFTKDVRKFYFGQPVIVDGKAYAVTVNDDASRIQAAEADIPTGSVKIDRARWSATFIGRKYHSTVDGSDKPVSLPADTYAITNYTEKGEGNSQLMIRQAAGTVEVAAGKTVDIKIGEPLTVGFSIQQSNGNVVFNLGCTDVSGSPIATLINAQGSTPPPPKFTVCDSSGKQVYQASLTYG